MKEKKNYSHFRFEPCSALWKVTLKKGEREVEFGQVRYDKNKNEYFLDIMDYVDGINLKMARELSDFLSHVSPRGLSEPRKRGENEKD